jgi:hypothetical protein
MPNPKYAAYQPADPYFSLVRLALGGLVDGEHFFDIVAEDVVYEVLYDIAGWPRVIQGRPDLMAQFRGYCENVELQSADKLITHKTDDGHTASSNMKSMGRSSRLALSTTIDFAQSSRWKIGGFRTGETTWILWRPGTR